MPRKKQQLEPDDSHPESRRRITEEIILDTQRVWSPRYAVGVVCALTVLLWAPAALAQVPRAGSDGPGEAPDEWVQAMIAWGQGFAAWQKETSSPRQAVFNVGFRVVCNAPKALAALDPASTAREANPTPPRPKQRRRRPSPTFNYTRDTLGIGAPVLVILMSALAAPGRRRDRSRRGRCCTEAASSSRPTQVRPLN
jgi:hypothetical protein